ncbi:YkvA family protein [Robertmurraya korlensis]|uniref:YkvA family protein n=1 Tax=Robertmurraya korlensis TaxID=519977 RepID=UPI0008244725|nr:DUF1232 domain-containing protein [Robertmurraya korlensis]
MRKVWKRITFVVKFWRFLPFIRDFYFARDVEVKHKAWPVVFIIGYLLLPVDVIPDVFAIFGFTDDLLITTFILQRLVKIAPPWLKEKYNLNDKKLL